MIENYLGSNIAHVIVIPFYVFATFFALFLFFRAGRHDFLDEEILLDSALVALVGSLIAGRIVDFFTRVDFYAWSFKKLFFFNVFFGFSWYGAAAGAFVLTFFYLKTKKQKIFFVLDLAAAPLVFGAMSVFVVNYLFFGKLSSLLYFLYLLIVFWTLKRLAKVKRFEGFFITLALILFGVLNAAVFWWFDSSQGSFGFLISSILVLTGAVLYYRLSNRKVRADLKDTGASLLLTLFKLKRVAFSKSEANLFAKSILFSPYYLAKLVVYLVKLLGREIYLSFIDLAHVVGVGK